MSSERNMARNKQLMDSATISQGGTGWERQFSAVFLSFSPESHLIATPDKSAIRSGTKALLFSPNENKSAWEFGFGNHRDWFRRVGAWWRELGVRMGRAGRCGLDSGDPSGARVGGKLD